MRPVRSVAAGMGLAASVAVGLTAAACSLDLNGTESLSPDATAGDGPSIDTSLPIDVASDPISEVFIDSGDAGFADVFDASDGAVDPFAVCLSRCTMDGGSCDDAGVCSISCGLGNPCASVQCPAGIPCSVDCTGQNACAGGVDCADASVCSVTCVGSSTCGAIACGGSTCNILCSASGTCTGAIMCNASGSCTIDCTTPGACTGPIHTTSPTTTVRCTQPSTCTGQVTCSGTQCQVFCVDGGCTAGECCDASSCSPQAGSTCM